jgi:hypothetical protein
VAFVGQTSGREVEARQTAVEMLEQFMASDHGFAQWQKVGQKSVFESHHSRTEKSPQMNGQKATSRVHFRFAFDFSDTEDTSKENLLPGVRAKNSSRIFNARQCSLRSMYGRNPAFRHPFNEAMLSSRT